MEIPTRYSASLLFFIWLTFASFFFHRAVSAQDYITHPMEVDALDAILQQWNIPYKRDNNDGKSWNINSINPCKGFVVDDSNDKTVEENSTPGKLEILCLCDQNSSTCNLIKLAAWDLDISGTIPVEIHNLTKLVYLDISSNSISGELPTFLWNLSDIRFMYLASNNFYGLISPEIGNLKNIKTLDISHNSMSGELPTFLWNLSDMRFMDLASNNFYGSIPPEIGNLKNIKTLWLTNNSFNGLLPSEIGNLRNIQMLELSSNNFNGSLPSDIGNLKSIKELWLKHNNFDGLLPSEIGNLKNIQKLTVSNNNFGGNIPHSIWNLTNMEGLWLYNNIFNGSLPQEIGNLKNIISLDLSSNKLEGEIPNSFWNLTNLKDLQLSANSFQGSIPSAIGNLVNLTTLDLSENSFQGSIPSNLGNLVDLKDLDLSENSFQGSIPSNLGNLVNLNALDLSHNDLTGSIPNSLIKRRNEGSMNLSVIGNPGLCNDCRRSSSNKTMIIIIAIVCSIIAALAVIIFFVWKVKTSSRNSILEEELNDGSLQGAPIHVANKEFTYLDLVTMTSNFNKIIGKGGFGNVYYGIDQRNGSQVAVKVLSNSSVQGSKEFQMEAQILTRIHHKNLVSLVGYCTKSDHLALVYEYMEGGSLKKLISGQCSNSTTISWRDRMRMAMEIAQGLDYLHRGCQPAIVHRDVKTTNILLSRYFEVKIADFGLSKLFDNDANTGMSTNVMGTFGYIDPEYYRTRKLNEKSDVYSFGIVLFELITGKSAIIDQAEERIPIATLVEPMLEKGEIDKIVDPNLNGKYNPKSAQKALEIAFACIPPTSMERPLMFDVVKQLKECLEIEIPQPRKSANSVDYDNEDITAPFAR